MGKFESIVVEAPRPLSEVALESYISVAEAAKIKGVSHDTYKRHYSHNIEKLSTRRNGVKLRVALGR